MDGCYHVSVFVCDCDNVEKVMESVVVCVVCVVCIHAEVIYRFIYS